MDRVVERRGEDERHRIFHHHSPAVRTAGSLRCPTAPNTRVSWRSRRSPARGGDGDGATDAQGVPASRAAAFVSNDYYDSDVGGWS